MRDASTILIQNIFHMLCYAFKVLRQRNYQDVGTEDFAHVQDMLANPFPWYQSADQTGALQKLYKHRGADKDASRKINLYQTKMLQERKSISLTALMTSFLRITSSIGF